MYRRLRDSLISSLLPLRITAASVVFLGLLIAGLPAAAQGTIATVAGNGGPFFSGDGGLASSAALNHPRGLAVSAARQIFISDVDNLRIRAVSPAGTIATAAGNGISAATGDGGLAVNASVSDAMGLALDAAGNLYIADASNRRVRKVTPSGMIVTVAGTGREGFFRGGGPARLAVVVGPCAGATG